MPGNINICSATTLVQEVESVQSGVELDLNLVVNVVTFSAPLSSVFFSVILCHYAGEWFSRRVLSMFLIHHEHQAFPIFQHIGECLSQTLVPAPSSRFLVFVAPTCQPGSERGRVLFCPGSVSALGQLSVKDLIIGHFLEIFKMVNIHCFLIVCKGLYVYSKFLLQTSHSGLFEFLPARWPLYVWVPTCNKMETPPAISVR